MQQQLGFQKVNPTGHSKWGRTCLAEDLKFLFLLLISGQSSKLLQKYRGGRGGDVQEVLESLVDGGGRDTILVGPVTNHT